MKKVLELRAVLRAERDQPHQEVKAHQYKEQLERTEKELVAATVRVQRLQAEKAQAEKEAEASSIRLVKATRACKEAQRESQELLRLVRDKDGFQALQDTVDQLSGILFSKRND